jgi:ribosomal protein L37E
MIGGRMETQPLTFDCPRCGRRATERFWGPCTECRDQLAAAMAREARTVEVGAFEPAMHVVPNQVATKE